MILLINIRDFKIMESTKVHSDYIYSIDFNPKNKILAENFGNYIKLWHINNLSDSIIIKPSICLVRIIKFGFNRLYCFGIEEKIVFYDDKDLKYENAVKLQSFQGETFCVSNK